MKRALNEGKKREMILLKRKREERQKKKVERAGKRMKAEDEEWTESEMKRISLTGSPLFISSLIIILLLCVCTCIFVLFISSISLKRRKRTKKERGTEEEKRRKRNVDARKKNFHINSNWTKLCLSEVSFLSTKTRLLVFYLPSFSFTFKFHIIRMVREERMREKI